MKYFITVLLFILLLSFGCAKRQAVTEAVIVEDILFEEIKEDTTEISEITFTEEPEEDISIFEEEELELSATEPKKMLGYRVQISAFKNKTAADQEASRAKLILDKYVYVEYIIPYYKLRVGNFLTKSDATSYLNQVVNKGFKGAFIVETTIIVE